MSKITDLTGNKYGRWTVSHQVESIPGKLRNRSAWMCACSCGNVKIVAGDALKSGDSKSCGCLHKDSAKRTCISRNTSHSDSKSKEYECWKGMKSRCYNKNRDNYEHYGEKGIEVCTDWKDSYENFLADMGRQPNYDVTWTVERKDRSKPYCKENCKWEIWDFQARNRGMASNNTSGVTGVMYREAKTVGSPCWIAQWTKLDGKKSTKSFSIGKYGNDKAYELALNARNTAIDELNKLGARYSPDHGK